MANDTEPAWVSKRLGGATVNEVGTSVIVAKNALPAQHAPAATVSGHDEHPFPE